MQRNPLLLLTLVVILLAGCGDGQKKSEIPTTPLAGAPETTCVYEGDDGFSVVAAFRDTLAWVFLPSGTVSLPHVVSASGAKYSNGLVTLWTKGQDAILSRPGLDDQVMHNDPRRAVWEQAKLSGMDFRAVGNEPGWVLELWGDGRVVFRGDYGQNVVEYPRPEPVTDNEKRVTTYTCGDTGELVVTLEEKPCRDTMSGEEFETSVTVTLDGKSYQGCGRPLH